MVASETSEVAPPITPAIATGRSRSQISRSSAVSVRSDVVEGHQPLAVGRVAHDDAGAGEPVQVERVQRLAELEHRVVRGVDHGRDRPHARGREPGLHA